MQALCVATGDRQRVWILDDVVLIGFCGEIVNKA